MGFFEKLKNGLKKTKDSMMGRIESLLHSFNKIDEDLFEELEETLILCDIGVTTSEKICDKLRQKVKQEGVKEPEKIKDMLKEIITEMLGEDQKLDMSTTPSVILVIGVNGVGKTTTIGKLAYQLHKQGKKVIVAAADTFRAAAIDQLEVWTERAGVDIIKHNEGSDPASVVFDALAAAKARQADVVICDTAGRLHNKKNLMDELKKISRIVHQQAEGCALEVLLALDATTGQNAVNQARQFNEVADITGIILTKLDGTAKGGIIISITDDLQVPVKLVTVGEKIDDIQPFSARDFVEAKGEGLDLVIDQGGHNLSGGQRQRLTIARALVRDPQILIMDDSASALDFATDARLRKAIRENTKDMTVFIVSQRATTIRNADTILVLDDGKLAGMGSHKQLLKECDVYREICLSQLSKEEVERDEQ